MEQLAEELGRYVVRYCATEWCCHAGIEMRHTPHYEDVESAERNIAERIKEAKEVEREKVWPAESAEFATLKEEGRVLPAGAVWPSYEDGTPLMFHDAFEAPDGKVIEKACCVALSMSDDIKMQVVDNKDNRVVLKKGEHVKRLRPKVLDAHGVEINPGDVVYDKKGGRWKVLDVRPGACLLRYRGDADSSEEAVCMDPAKLSHERPDSWERLREDAANHWADYWGCVGRPCMDCPAVVDGATPAGRYHTNSCEHAKCMDLLARAERLAGEGGKE